MRRSHLAALTLSLGLLALCAAAVGPDARQTADPTDLERPDLIVARFHADWCGACKTLAPKFDALKQAAADERVLFVTLDLTTAESRSQAALLAGALGLDKAWALSGLKTGQVMIICGRYKEVIATVPAAEDLAASLEKLRDALAMIPQH